MEENKVDKEALEKDDNQKEANAFVRLKERMSKRSKGKGRVKSDQDRKVPGDSTDKNEAKDYGNRNSNDKNKSEEPKFGRVIERFSMRSKKKKKEEKNGEVSDTNVDRTSELNETTKLNGDQASMPEKNETADKKEKKEENFIQRIFKRLSFRSKTKMKKSETNHTDEPDMNNETIEMDSSNKGEDDAMHLNENVIKKSESENSLEEDLEIQALCKDEKEEKVVTPTAPIITNNRPPLPTSRRVPPSATSTQSRPVSQLDAALKQFRLSTAASRENLRSSRVDLEKMEDTVRSIVGSRPSSRAATPTPDSWRSRAPPENRQLSEQWAKLSASLTDLR